MTKSFADSIDVYPICQQESHVGVPKAVKVKSTAMDVKSRQKASERLIYGIACGDGPVLTHED